MFDHFLLQSSSTVIRQAGWPCLLPAAAAAATRSVSHRSGVHQRKTPLELAEIRVQQDRKKQLRSAGGFETSIGACGPLVDGPDYTFLDGRPTPLRKGQIQRALAQRQASTTVLQLLKETQFAIQRKEQQCEEQQQRKQQVLQAKLKAKGPKMLQGQDK